jgi:pimeloyl-ACP methyl ester carboxylesterase
MLRHEYADVNGVRLHYVTTGKGKLILFLHGFPEFWYMWKRQLVELGRDYQAVAVDMRGYNLSSKPAEVEQYQIPRLVEDIRALAHHLGQKKFILVGHDWGGAVAWAFALYHPEYLEKLVIINAPHPAVGARELRENPAQQKASEYMLKFRSPQAEQILSANNYSRLLEAILGDRLRRGYLSEEDRQAYLEAWSQPGALTGGLNYYRAAQVGPPTGDASEPPRSYLAELPSPVVKVPTLVIWGEKDAYLLTGNLEGLEEFVPDLTLRRIPDASHWVVHEQPDRVNAYIREFIADKR